MASPTHSLRGRKGGRGERGRRRGRGRGEERREVVQRREACSHCYPYPCPEFPLPWVNVVSNGREREGMPSKMQ